MIKIVPLNKIKDNPYRNYKRNPLQEKRLDALEESLEKTEFWIGVYGREVGDFVEIAFGHHRVKAARDEGLKEIPVEIQGFTNSDMLIRMSRENLRGDLLGSLEIVEAAVKAYATGDIALEELSPKTPLSSIRYAPSFISGGASDRTVRSHPYTADTLARFLGGVYVQKPVKREQQSAQKRAKQSVHAALGVLELEERAVAGFSVPSLRKLGSEDEYRGSKEIVEMVTAVKQRVVKVAERQEAIKKAAVADAEKQRKLQEEMKAREDAAEAVRQVELDKLKAAREAEDKKESDRLFLKMKAQGEAQIAKNLADKGKLEAIELRVAERKRKEEEARNEDAYAPIRRDVERALFKMDSVSTGSFCEDIKSLAKRKLSLKDRQRLWESASALADWYGGWVCSQFVVAPDQLQPKRGTISKRRTK